MAIEIEVLEKKKETVTFYTTKEIKNILKKIAKEKNGSVSYVINAVLVGVFKEELENEEN
ncbi:hypothetical protein FSBG_00407 [Fusobacterium gonidiaformans 3-1-5R]|uniref:CopG-like ribbon-helix-helix domain-containing protein n=1 Tax=Fusobacterium gonidiaformans 3-1-5R TaxID=469605 RepID=E5BFM9_9FUSO|nr:hypothetical protein [Fusobacterium gonidiaformans]EFS20910.1 hypothetical protein FSBG_00407 [Fusobacterium gonidiaformans 3-1-5R]